MTIKVKNLTVVAIGAHPDDFELGAAMRLYHHIERGDEVVGIICSDGECAGEGERRVSEARYSAKKMGIEKLYFLRKPDTMIPMIETKDEIEGIILEEKPSVVYTHSYADTHQDHEAVSKASKIACRNIPNILTYKSPSTIENSFNPSAYHLGSKEDFEKKKEILGIFKTQLERNISLNLDSVELFARYYAEILKCPKNTYAEPFEANHIILNLMR